MAAFVEGNVLIDRYMLLRYLSYGTFSDVWLVYDISENLFRALKVQHPQHYKDALEEADTMTRLMYPEPSPYLPRLSGTFTVREGTAAWHCFVLELLGQDTYTLLKDLYPDPLPLPCVKHVLRTVIRALDFLHSRRYMHTDIKLENVIVANPLVNRRTLETTEWFYARLQGFIGGPDAPGYEAYTTWRAEREHRERRRRLRTRYVTALQEHFRPMFEAREYRNWRRADDDEAASAAVDRTGKEATLRWMLGTLGQAPAVRLCDFGGVTKIDDNPASVQTIQYRAPEVFLETKIIDEKIDIWSIGCLAYELVTSHSLFNPQKKHAGVGGGSSSSSSSSSSGSDDDDDDDTDESDEWDDDESEDSPSSTASDTARRDASMLYQFEKIIGELPWRMVQNAERREELFDRKNRLRICSTVLEAYEVQCERRRQFAEKYGVGRRPADEHAVGGSVWNVVVDRLRESIGSSTSSSAASRSGPSLVAFLEADPYVLRRLGDDDLERQGFISFVRECLTYDPHARPTAKELLQHRWIKEEDAPAAG